MTGSETPRARSAPTIDAEGVVGFTQALVQVPSVHDPARGLNEEPAAALVAERMRGFGWEPVIEEVAPGRPNVIAVLDSGVAGPTLLFEGHTDVVTEGDSASWTHDPFGGEIVDGRLYGRGAADMKAGLAAMLYAAASVSQAGSFPGRIVLAALVDEEGMMTGAKHFVAAGHGRGVDAAIVCEPEGGEVCLAQKGALRLRVDARGRMAHGAMPDHGRNPLPALGQVMGLLARFERKLQQELGSHVHLGLPFLTPTVLQAGQDEQMNVIPANAHLAVDVRTVPGIDHAELVAGLRREAREVSERTGVALDLTVIEDRPPTQLAAEEPVVDVLRAAHTAVVGEPPPFGGVPGTTDGTILWRDGRIPAVVYGPGGKWIAHQGNEFVLVDEIVQYAQVYAEAALRFLRRAA